jgi:hypothetical protein
MNSFCAMNENAKTMMHSELEGCGEEQTDFFNNLFIPWLLTPMQLNGVTFVPYHIFWLFLSVHIAMF